MIDAETLPTITAARIDLRWLVRGDVPDLYAIFSHMEVMRYWSSPAMKQPEEAEALLAQIHRYFEEKTLFQWGVALREDGRVIGTCTLAELDQRNRRAAIGYALNREHWGKGLMEEALVALLDFAFSGLNLHRLEADVDPRNERSITLLEKLGFEREGYLRERWLAQGEVQDSIVELRVRSGWGDPDGVGQRVDPRKHDP